MKKCWKWTSKVGKVRFPDKPGVENWKMLSNNAELYQYLLRLSATLEERNAKQLGEAVVHASKCSAGMSAEFLGESRIALRRVLKKGAGVLTTQERDDVKGRFGAT